MPGWGHSAGFPSSMIFTVALCVSWCGRLEAMPLFGPQVYATDNLKCSSVCPRALFSAARFTAQYVHALGQDVSPGKCLLLITSKAVRRSMKSWDLSGDGRPWSVELDVRDLGGHLDFAGRLRAGTLCRRAVRLLMGLLRLGRCHQGFSPSWVFFVVCFGDVSHKRCASCTSL